MNQNKEILHGDFSTVMHKLLEISKTQPYGTLYNIALEVFPSKIEEPSKTTPTHLSVNALASRWNLAYKTVQVRYPKGLSLFEVEEQEKKRDSCSFIQKTTFSDFFEDTGRDRRSAQTYLTKMKTVDLCGKKYLWIEDVGSILKRLGYKKEETLNYLKYKEGRKIGRV